MVKKILFIIIASFIVSCGSSKKVVKKTSTKRNTVTRKKTTKKTTQASLADKIVWSAVSYKGTPYKYAGTSKKGMDCSGLIYISFKARNVLVPRSSSLLYKEGYKIPLSRAKRGDLLFFKTTRKTRSKINHVALVTSVDNGVVKFIHATSSRGVIVSAMTESYWRKSFVEAKRVL